LRELYVIHMKMNAKVKKVNPYAFFVDNKGRTISGGAYERKFAKVKYAYIDRLASTPGRYSDFKMLDDTIWGTHIGRDRKSTRLNSSHVSISYAVFCLKK